jgi:hypothetical protein
VHQGSDGEQVVGEDGSTDQQLKPLPAFGETPFHSTAAEQDRDATLDTGAETLPLFERRALLMGGA